MMSHDYFTIILGAGASGLACAGAASKAGPVLLLDHAQKSACKVDISGGGKANFTNRHLKMDDFHTTNHRFCLSALAKFTPEDCLAWLDSHKILYEEREHGQFFCLRSAKDFSRILRLACTSNASCTILLETTIQRVQKIDDAFVVSTSKGDFSAPNLVIALGSPAFPQAGASALGVHLAKQFGHPTRPFRPALVGLVTKEWGNGELAGISLTARVHVLRPKQHPVSITDFPVDLPLLFTHTGMSGPAILQASLVWEEDLPITIDFLPALCLETYLKDAQHGKMLLANALKQFFPERFALWLLTSLQIPNGRVAEMAKKNRQRLCKTVHEYTFVPQGTEGYKKAEVAKGGVETSHVSSKTFESTLVPGLYFCGEVLNVTGRLGGYNLHWALASGKAAGEAILAKV